MLISVAVITFNSQRTIVETLESIKRQRYNLKNVELVICDDCSKDDTTLIANNWLNENKSTFYSSDMVVNSLNLGISGNCNVAYKNCNGEWIKLLAGDDLLTEDCLEIYTSNIKEHTQVFLAKQRYFGNNNIKIGPRKEVMKFFNLDAFGQYKMLLKNTPFLPSPTLFIRRKSISDVNGCVDKYRYIEDYPLFLKLTSSNVKIEFIDKITVLYRSEESITQSTNRLVNVDSMACRELVYEDMVYPNLSGFEKTYKYLRKYEFFVTKLISKMFGNKRNLLSVCAIRFFLFHKKLPLIIFSFRAKLGGWFVN
ncbi:glycosyltransferase family 2 protein [Vibrio cyclitrophicus]